MNIKNIKIGDRVKIKNKNIVLNFWESCGGKIFKVVHVDYKNDSIYLDFRGLYIPKFSGSVDISSIKKIVPRMRLQNDLFEL